MLFDRTITKAVKESVLKKDFITLIFGSRQVGKTTLLNQILPDLPYPQIILNGDDLITQEKIVPRLDILNQSFGNAQLIAIDEAQRIENIGLSLKIIHDQLHIPTIVTGSSALDLASKINESLTGRTGTFLLFPLSVQEVPPLQLDSDFHLRLPQYLRFGMYPKVISETDENSKQAYLSDLLNNFLYKDLLSFQGIKKPKKVVDLLALIAYQIGSQVSIQELSRSLSLDRVSVEKYLDLLEKMYILYNLRGFSRNLRKEISKTSKYYFFDLGLRNAIIRNFNPLNLRNDIGQLFENFCIIERVKLLANNRIHPNFYFWRTWDQKEIDLIEEYGGKLTAWEFKCSQPKYYRNTSYKEFSRTYTNSYQQIVTPDSINTLIRSR